MFKLISKTFVFGMIILTIVQSRQILAFGKDAKVRPNMNISQAANEFGWNLLKKLISDSKEKNVVISPLSISSALAMTLNGADGSTLKEMKKALAFEDWEIEEINRFFSDRFETLPSLDKEVTLNINNAIWYRQDVRILPNFIDNLKNFYRAEITSADFRKKKVVVKDINQWVSDKTNQKISSIIDRINPMDVLYLLNAVYFYGKWSYPFSEQSTVEDKFYVSKSKSIKCQMMEKTRRFGYLENDRFQIIGLPYGNAEKKPVEFFMYVILPKEPIAVEKLIAEMDADTFQQLIRSISYEKVRLRLPKFKIEFETSLKPALSSLGMKNPFTDRADFSRMSAQNVFISEVRHKTYIDVNEKGTEAAAVTAVTMVLSAAEPEKIYFMNVNRPFLFVITADIQKNNILFIGKIGNPQ